ncbi:cytochrome b561 [Rhodovulum imhoffii]|uniref:Cytochrome b561 n=1 Tax=Rhodovulum imhoffii TaxID=365340 RepID=A0A2T5BT05_9RHOB|nr:cytochrome b/b6 domain-containing protein [Rhodovulum imhoffii]MBK5932673.1 hypothetical protein [Rhodovulum imhoffii]PTN02511.1 cytochrome b561 [Rhodovulum imhoffii]
MSVSGYSRIQIRLHWVIVALVALQFLFNGWVSAAFRDGLERGATAMTPLAGGHIALGILVLVLSFWRLILRVQRGVPAPVSSHSAAQVKVSKGLFGAFYALLILLPVSGMVAWSQTSATAGAIHGLLTTLLLLLVILHVAAALAGHFLRKDGTMTRMRVPQD